MFRIALRSFAAVLFTFALAAAPSAAQGLPAGWASTDVGTTGAAGSAMVEASTFTVNGAGLDVWSTGDQFHYAYRALTGDGVIIARVASVESVASWTKAGVMMRESLDAGSRHAFMLVSPGKGLAFQRRVSTGGLSTHTSGGSGVAPYWVRLERLGNVFTASRSLDGAAWTNVGAQTIDMASTIYVGLAVGSHVSGVLATAAFDQVSVKGVLPVGWSSGDVGAVGAEGGSLHANGTFVLDGAGLDVWGTSDQFHFTHRVLSGDGAIVARVASVENVSAWTKAGVMIRETLAADSKHAFMLVSPGKGLAFQRRPSTGGSSVHTSGGAGRAPAWVKLERTGDVLTASKSLDGTTWTVVGTQTIAMTQEVYVGVAVGSHVTGVLATATFERVAVTESIAPAEPPADEIIEPPTGPGSGTGSANPTFRLLHWNSHHGGRRTDGVYDPAGFAAWLASFNADVITLNEVDTVTQAENILMHLKAQTPGVPWTYYFLGHMKGNMILSRLPLEATSTCVVNAADDRRVAHVNVLVHGRVVNVWDAHLSLDSSAERTAETRAMQACEQNWAEARIAAGDYNMQADTAEYKSMTEGHVDAWRAAKALGTAKNYSGNCDGCTRNSRIDYVFTSKGATALTLQSAEIVDTRNASGVMPSDHKPLLVVYAVE